MNQLFDEIDMLMREIIKVYDGMDTLESIPIEEGNEEDKSYISLLSTLYRKKEEELFGYSAILNLNHGALYYDKRCMLAYL